MLGARQLRRPPPAPDIYRPRSQFYDRQLDLENRSPAEVALDRKLAGMVLYDALHDPESQARSFFSLGGNKGFKNRANHLWRDTGAGISDKDAYPSVEIVGAGTMAAAQAQSTAVGHGVLGIDDQVGKHLADLVGGNHRVRQDFQFRLRFHVGALELAVQQQQRVLNNRIDADRLALLRVAIQTQHLPHNAGYPLGFRI